MQQIVSIREITKNNLLVLTQFQNRILINFDVTKKISQVFEITTKGSNETYCLLNAIRENQEGELLALISDRGLFHVNWKDKVLGKQAPGNE